MRVSYEIIDLDVQTGASTCGLEPRHAEGAPWSVPMKRRRRPGVVELPVLQGHIAGRAVHTTTSQNVEASSPLTWEVSAPVGAAVGPCVPLACHWWLAAWCRAGQ